MQLRCYGERQNCYLLNCEPYFSRKVISGRSYSVSSKWIKLKLVLVLEPGVLHLRQTSINIAGRHTLVGYYRSLGSAVLSLSLSFTASARLSLAVVSSRPQCTISFCATDRNIPRRNAVFSWRTGRTALCGRWSSALVNALWCTHRLAAAPPDVVM